MQKTALDHSEHQFFQIFFLNNCSLFTTRFKKISIVVIYNLHLNKALLNF